MEILRGKAAHLSRRLCLTFVVLGVAFGATACSSSTSAATRSKVAAAPSGSATAIVSVAKSSKLGDYLVGVDGRTLYLFELDTNGKSHCSGACAQVWPPLTTSGKPRAGNGVSASMLGTVTDSGGKTQVTYNGHPLYYFSSDATAGQTVGQGVLQFGARWYVVSPQGAAILKGAKSSSNSSYGGSTYGG